MKNSELIKILEKQIEEYDVFTDNDVKDVNAMKNCVNVLSGYTVYKEVA